MAQNKLSYVFEEKPEWKDADVPPTTEMITEITEWQIQYSKLPQEGKDFCNQQFARAMAVDYIKNLNAGEMVGTQNDQDTEELLKEFFENSSMSGESDADTNRSVTELETINTYKAMRLLRDKAKEMQMSGLLTVQEICDVHGLLLKGLHPNCGKIRQKEAYTHWHNGPHFYPNPKQAAALFYSLIDHHNMNMENKPSDDNPNELTTYIFKCAARLLFDFVNTHPFSDGNGRMCRLLANYVVGVITPFPVSVYHTRNPERSGREDYLNAIVSCRQNPAKGPQGLAAMLVEGAWRGWKSLFENLESRRQLYPGVNIGPIVVKKSNCSEEYVSKRVNGILDCAETEMKAKVVTEKVVAAAIGATKETDVSNLDRNQYLQKTVPVEGSISVALEIYP